MKNELFNLIEATSGDLCVLGSELHEFLEVKTVYHKWIKRMFEYGFVENVDYLLVVQKCPTNNPKNPFTVKNDYYLKMDMAKEISMIQRNEKGKEARRFFIQAEKERNGLKKRLHEGKKPSYMIEDEVERAARWIEERKEMKQLVLQVEHKDNYIEEMKPKVQYHDEVLEDTKGIAITVIAKEYGMTASALNEILNDLKIIYKQDNSWVLYSKYQNQDYHTTKTIKRYGQIFINYKWTQKGRRFIYDVLAENGIYTVDKMRESAA